MSEIRIKFKTFVVGSAIILFLLFYLMFRSPSCETSSTVFSSSSMNLHQVQERKNQSSTQPFTVYAITPTYARPVQKAELTR